MNAKVLLVDDDSAAVESLARAVSLELSKVDLHVATSKPNALSLFNKERSVVAVVDLNLEGDGGIEGGFSLIRELRTLDSSVRIIVLTGHGKAEFGVRALNLGAASFIEKPADVKHLAALIRDGISLGTMQREFRDAQVNPKSKADSLLIGSSDAIKKVKDATLFAASSAQSVMILGETGTGKGVCARVIHESSARAFKNLVRYQPSFASGDIVQSELFGHTKGSFTGAIDNRRGLLKEADAGTLFIDEVDEIPVDVQVILLNFLQEGVFRSVGAQKEEQVDVRLIAASNRPINETLESGKLRRDFYHRLAHLTITLPPLRERKQDISAISEAALLDLNNREQLNVFEISPEAITKLNQYNWPGNVRELIAIVESGAYKARFEGRSFVESSDLNLSESAPVSEAKDLHSQIEEFKIRMINESLARHGGNQVQAAKELGLDRGTIRRVLSRS